MKPWLIRKDIAKAVQINRWIDVLWATPAGRATLPPSQVVTLPVILPLWESFA